MQEVEQLVIDAIDVGLAAMHKVPEELKEVVLDFIKKYGFLGFMTALPTSIFLIFILLTRRISKRTAWSRDGL